MSKLHFTCAEELFGGMKKVPKTSEKKYSLPLFWDIERELSSFLTKFFSRVLKTTFFVSIGIFWWDLYFLRKNQFFRNLSKKVLAFCPKVLGAFVRIAFSASRKTLWGKIDFLKKKLFFLSFAKTEPKLISFLAKTILRASENCVIGVQRNTFGKNISLKKIPFRTGRELLAFRIYYTNRVVKTAFYVSRRTLRRDVLSQENKFSHLPTSSEEAPAFCRKVFEMFVTFTFPVSRRTFWGQTNFWRKKSFSHSQTLSYFFSACCQNNYAGFVKTVFYVHKRRFSVVKKIRKTVWKEKDSFLDTEREIFRLFFKVFTMR